MFDLLERYFAQPLDEKELNPQVKGIPAGYSCMRDVREFFSVQGSLEAMHTKWPRIVGFREHCQQWMEQCHGLLLRIIGCFALKLGLACDYFEDMHQLWSEKCLSVLKMIHYP